MLPNITEIIVILIIVAIVFGFGKLGKISAVAARLKTNFNKGLEGEDGVEPIDITPQGTGEQEPMGPKPGTQAQPVEDAELVDNSEEIS